MVAGGAGLCVADCIGGAVWEVVRGVAWGLYGGVMVVLRVVGGVAMVLVWGLTSRCYGGCAGGGGGDAWEVGACRLLYQGRGGHNRPPTYSPRAALDVRNKIDSQKIYTHALTYVHRRARARWEPQKQEQKHKKSGWSKLRRSCRAARDVLWSVEAGRSARRCWCAVVQSHSLLPLSDPNNAWRSPSLLPYQ